MKYFRLKKEAIPFFKETHATSILSWDSWAKLNVDDNALEEVESCYIEFGQQINSGRRDNCGWNSKDGAEFKFTIKFPSMKYKEYDKISDGKVMGKLMRNIQDDLNDFYFEFAAH